MPWPLPGLRSAKPTASTLLRSTLSSRRSLRPHSGCIEFDPTHVGHIELALQVVQQFASTWLPTSNVPSASFRTGRTSWNPDVLVYQRIFALPVRSTKFSLFDLA